MVVVCINNPIVRAYSFLDLLFSVGVFIFGELRSHAILVTSAGIDRIRPVHEATA